MSNVKLLLLGIIATLIAPSTTQRIYSIAIGHEWGSHEYFDDKGYLKGFSIGFIDLVCEAGMMDCRVVRDAYRNCWQAGEPGNHPSGGRGLFGGWYDGCLGWGAQVESIHTFSFSLPYITRNPSNFYVKKGNKGQSDPFDLSGKKVGFINGWGGNEQCIARHTKITNRVLKADQIKFYDTPTELIQGMQNNEVEFTFGPEEFWTVALRAQLDIYENTAIHCFLSGPGLMTRKDNEILNHWNTAFTKLKNGRKFLEYCERANMEHGHKGVAECIKN